MTQTIKPGDTISVDYTGRIKDGDVFDSSEGREPLKFTVGAGMLIKGFDEAVVGMTPGDQKTVVIDPENGYGPRNEELFVDVPKMHFPEDIPLSVGLQLQLQDPQGRPVPASVVEINEESVRMDINHFLAGKTLEFDITIVETGLTPDAHACGSEGCGCGCDGDPDSDAASGCDCGSGCK